MKNPAPLGDAGESNRDGSQMIASRSPGTSQTLKGSGALISHLAALPAR